MVGRDHEHFPEIGRQLVVGAHVVDQLADFPMLRHRDQVALHEPAGGFLRISERFLDRSAKIEKIGGDKVKQVLTIKSGIDSDTAKKIQTLVKQSKLKVQAAIQGDTVRVTGTKRDDLQGAMALLRKDIADAPLSFTNFRD